MGPHAGGRAEEGKEGRRRRLRGADTLVLHSSQKRASPGDLHAGFLECANIATPSQGVPEAGFSKEQSCPAPNSTAYGEFPGFLNYQLGAQPSRLQPTQPPCLSSLLFSYLLCFFSSFFFLFLCVVFEKIREKGKQKKKENLFFYCFIYYSFISSLFLFIFINHAHSSFLLILFQTKTNSFHLIFLSNFSGKFLSKKKLLEKNSMKKTPKKRK